MLKLSCVLLCLVHLCWSNDHQASPLEIEFFSFSAPNEASQQRTYVPKQSAASKKIHQQVIFIKNPENRVNHNAIAEPIVSPAKQKLQQTQQQTYHKPEAKHAKYHGEPRNIQEKIAQQEDEGRIRY